MGCLRGLSAQAIAVVDAIHEVDELLRCGNGDSEVLLEGHPKLAFQASNGDELAHSKASAVGVVEWIAAFKKVSQLGYSQGDWRDLATELQTVGLRVGLDDLLDATALALTAMGPSRRTPPLSIRTRV